MKTTTKKITAPVGNTSEWRDLTIRTEGGDLKINLLQRLILEYGNKLHLPATLTGEILSSREFMRRQAKKAERERNEVQKLVEEHEYVLYDVLNLLGALTESTQKLHDAVAKADIEHQPKSVQAAMCTTENLLEIVEEYLDGWEEDDYDIHPGRLYAYPRPEE